MLVLAHFSLGDVPASEGERYDWGLYLTLGIVYPALIVAAGVARRVPRLVDAVGAWGPTAVFALGAVAMVVPWLAIMSGREWTVAAMALAQLALVVGYDRRAGRRIDPVRLVAAAAIVPIAWAAAVRLVHWAPFDALIRTPGPTPVAIGPILLSPSLIAFAVSLVVVSVGVHRLPRSLGRVPRPVERLADLMAVMALLVLSSRTDELFAGQVNAHFHHWYALIGPAELVRQGGWLLWDVPGQYGFLNTWLVASLPVGSVWQAAYVITSMSVAFAALFLYVLFRTTLRGPIGPLLAFVLTYGALFVMDGNPPGMSGPKGYPGNGPYRFVWVYVLLAVLVLDFTTRGRGRRRWVVPILGSAVWVIGSIWSAESAVYCAAIWLPAYVLMTMREIARTRGGRRFGWDAFGAFAARLCLPVGLLALTLAAIAAVYLAGLGHLPDWRAYFDYALAFGGGYAAEPIDLNGPVWALLLVLFLAASSAWRGLRRGWTDPSLGLLVGTSAALWATASYYVARSHPNNAVSLTPIFFVGLGTILMVGQRQWAAEWPTRLTRLLMVPIFTVVVTAAFGNVSALAVNLGSFQQAPPINIDRLLPPMESELASLLRSAGVTPDDAIVLVDPVVPLGAWPDDSGGTAATIPWHQPTWLPSFPLYLMVPLPDTRVGVYFLRYTERARRGGWLVQRRAFPYTEYWWLAQAVDEQFTRVGMVESATWQAIRFEYSGRPAP